MQAFVDCEQFRVIVEQRNNVLEEEVVAFAAQAGEDCPDQLQILLIVDGHAVIRPPNGIRRQRLTDIERLRMIEEIRDYVLAVQLLFGSCCNAPQRVERYQFCRAAVWPAPAVACIQKVTRLTEVIVDEVVAAFRIDQRVVATYTYHVVDGLILTQQDKPLEHVVEGPAKTRYTDTAAVCFDRVVAIVRRRRNDDLVQLHTSTQAQCLSLEHWLAGDIH